MSSFPVGDAHCDFLYYAASASWEIGTRIGKQVMHLPYLQQGGVALQLFAAWIDAEKRKPFWKQCTDMMDAYDRMLARHTDSLTPFTASFSPECGKIACLLTVEGGEAIEGDPARLETLYARGVRAMTLTWNFRNELAFPAEGRRNGGLSKLGKQVVDDMCALGIAVDLAHLSDAGIDDVLSRATRPVFASHSNARTVYDCRRSLQDEHIRAIASAGGIVCVNFYPKQLCAHAGGASCEDILRHIDYIAALVGAEHVGVGSDFDGMNCYPKDLHDSRDYPALFARLLQMGYTQTQVERIAYTNLRDYLAPFCA